MSSDYRVSRYFLKFAFNMQKSCLVFMVFQSLVRTATQLLSVLMPKFLLDKLTGGRDVKVLFIYTVILAGGHFVLTQGDHAIPYFYA